ncbi:MAG TPA: single-stranded-DNA-specific exonuclease RecJ, partial [Stenotrophomonas sp.]|nr:single-stranded-DNA-specific exonuclease RecJ [Stenotrophomonas sp.]
LVTDHHLPGEQLPPADVLVDPNIGGDAFPSKALAGVGVIFYVLMALRRHLRLQGAFAAGTEPDLLTLLDLVAVGTVADLVVLDANNRALVSAGLRRLRA